MTQSPKQKRPSWLDRWFEKRSLRAYNAAAADPGVQHAGAGFAVSTGGSADLAAGTCPGGRPPRILEGSESARVRTLDDFDRFVAAYPGAMVTDGELPAVRIPGHIGIIMDGNGRWARSRGLDRRIGHRAGAENLKRVTETCRDLGVRYLTVYAFSTENWKRSNEEVGALMKLFVEFFHKYDRELAEEDIRLRFIGQVDALPEPVRETIRIAEAASAERRTMQLIIAFNYGGRRELVHSVRQIAGAVARGSLSPDAIDETTIAEHLYMPDVPDPDLIIRSSGEMRMSNFLLWESAYSEFWVSNVLWPDFGKQSLFQAVMDFNHRDRRFGGVQGKQTGESV